MRSARPIIVVLLAFLAVVDLSAQQQGTITGRVIDDAGQPLGSAEVATVETRQGTLTRADGTYLLEVEPGEHTVQVGTLGYAAQTASVTVTAGQEATLDFTLERDALALRDRKSVV